MRYLRDLDTDDAIQTLNLALFGEPIAQDELDFLTEYANVGGGRARLALADSYIASDEFQSSFAAGSNEDFVRSVSFNLFDRNATVNEAERWTTRLDNGAADERVLFKILDNASESDIEAYTAKLFIADYVTEQEAAGGYVPDMLTTQFLRSNAEVYDALEALDARYETLTTEQVGVSLRGNPLTTATVGTGETDVVFITQQHGDEPIGTEAALLFLDFLAGDSAEAAMLREELTVTVLPRVNPDGFARWEQEVGGVRGVLDPRVNDSGIDLNRTYDPADPYSVQTAPESVAVRELVAQIDPVLLFDYHGQGNYRDADGDLDTMSVLWPTNPEVDPAVADQSRRASVVLGEAVNNDGYGQLTIYPGGEGANIARNGFSLRGTPTVLVEQRYSQEMFYLSEGLDVDYSALRSALALEGFISMKAVVESLASGAFEDVDPTLVEEIPDRSPGISYADLYSDDRYVPEDMLVA